MPHVKGKISEGVKISALSASLGTRKAFTGAERGQSYNSNICLIKSHGLYIGKPPKLLLPGTRIQAAWDAVFWEWRGGAKFADEGIRLIVYLK